MHYMIFIPNAKGDPADNLYAAGGLESLLRPGHLGPEFIDLDAGHWIIQEAFDKVVGPITKHLKQHGD